MMNNGLEVSLSCPWSRSSGGEDQQQRSWDCLCRAGSMFEGWTLPHSWSPWFRLVALGKGAVGAAKGKGEGNTPIVRLWGDCLAKQSRAGVERRTFTSSSSESPCWSNCSSQGVAHRYWVLGRRSGCPHKNSSKALWHLAKKISPIIYFFIFPISP